MTYWGEQENIHCIQNVAIKIETKQNLCLANKTTQHFYGAGAYLSDDGYVLGIVRSGDIQEYYSLTPEEITSYQESDSLPNPLPAYSISAFEYGMGYSLWIVLAFSTAWVLIDGSLKRRKNRLLVVT